VVLTTNPDKMHWDLAMISVLTPSLLEDETLVGTIQTVSVYLYDSTPSQEK
jgi:hypothetical protein